MCPGMRAIPGGTSRRAAASACVGMAGSRGGVSGIGMHANRTGHEQPRAIPSPSACHMVLDPVTLGFGPSDLAEFEVLVVETGIRHGGLTSSGLCADDPPTRWVRSCVELPGYARGWVPEPSPTHSTMLYTMMQVDRSPEAQVAHGRASTEHT